MLARIANGEDPDQTASEAQSDLGLHCLSRSFWQATRVRNFRTVTIFWLAHEINRDYVKEFWLSPKVLTQDPENG